MVDIQIGGVDATLHNLNRIQGIEWAVAPMQQSTQLLQARLAVYPPAPSQSTYERTGKLGQSWTTHITRTQHAVTGVVGTNRRYAPFVQDAGRQAWMHRGRWQTESDVLERSHDEILRLFEGAIARLSQ